MRQVKLTTYLDATPDQVWNELRTPRLLTFVAHPVIRFVPVTPARLPDRWEATAYIVKMRLLGFIPLGRQVIELSYPPPQGGVMYIRDNGHSRLVKRWDHLIAIEPEGDGTRYTDLVKVEAGLLTPIVAAFARRFYTHRQRRWAKLVAAGFEYDDV